MKRSELPIEEYLRKLYFSMKTRCNGKLDSQHNHCYTENMIFNLFESADIFIDYVVNVLKVDPRGLVIHRIDNDGHYEPGNIEFLTNAEHGKKPRRGYTYE